MTAAERGRVEDYVAAMPGAAPSPPASRMAAPP
jgi:hypothetical protein